MTYTIDIIRKSEQSTAVWSGGRTTQLAIDPVGSEYARRDFRWRISSAEVETDESVFTPLPGFERHLMVLEGEMTLVHEGHHRIHLKPYEQDLFDGGWTTRSYGKVTDFNLMLADGCSGKLETLAVDAGGLELHAASNEGGRESAEAFYCVSGAVCLTIPGEAPIDISAGDIIILRVAGSSEGLQLKLVNSSETESAVIRAAVKYGRD